MNLIDSMPLAQLKPHPRNYVKHPQDQLDHLKASIEQHGFYRNIVVAKDNTILAGHGVAEAAKQLGIETVPVVRVPLAPDEPRALKLLAGDNEVRHLVEVDDEGLAKLLDEIRTSDPLKLLGTGFDDDALEKLLAATGQREVDEDEAPAVRKTDIKLGDMFELGAHRILCGDSGNPEMVAKLMGGHKAQLIATDPPYGVDYTATKNGIPGSGFKNAQEHWGDIKGDELKAGELQAFLERVFRAAVPYLDNAAWYLWHAHLTAAFFAAAAAAAAAADVLLHRQII